MEAVQAYVSIFIFFNVQFGDVEAQIVLDGKIKHIILILVVGDIALFVEFCQDRIKFVFNL